MSGAENNDVLIDAQFGLRPLHRIIYDTIFALQTNVNVNLLKKNVDFRFVFNTLDIFKMLNKITILMGGIRGRPLNILRLFYDNNKDSVLPNGRISGGGVL